MGPVSLDRESRGPVVTAALDSAGAAALAIVGLALALPLIQEQEFSPVWYPALVIGPMVMISARRWWPYLAFLVLAVVIGFGRGGWPFDVGLLRVATDIAVVVGAVLLIRRTCRLPFRSTADAWHLILIATAAGAIRGILGVLTLGLRPQLGFDPVLFSLATGLSTVIGILILVPLLAIAMRPRARRPTGTQSLIDIAYLIVIAATIIVAFLATSGVLGLALAFVLIPLTMALAATGSQLALAVGLSITAVSVTAATAFERGAFTTNPVSIAGHLAGTVTAQIFIIALPAAGWLIAGSVEGSRRARRDLVQQVAEQQATAQRLAVAQEETRTLADFDPATGLHSRSWISRHLSALLDLSRSTHLAVAAMFVDLRQFDHIRRSLGYAAGDDLLRDIADEIRAVTPSSSEVGRFDGDRLIVILQGIDDPAHLSALAIEVFGIVRQERLVRGHRMAREAAVGMAVARPGSSVESLLRDADLALATATAQGSSGWKVFEPQDADQLGDVTLEHEIRGALENEEFVTVYQPQVRLSDGAVTGYEALVRWQHPRRGVVGPNDFIPAAERTGLIIPLGVQILSQVCQTLAAHPDCPPIAVNVSPIQLADEEWLDTLRTRLGIFEIAPDRIVIELTETAIFRLSDAASSALLDLHAAGTGIHVDDFGTGFSSLTTLRELPITGLKLDRSFVHGLDATDPSSLALVRGIAGLAEGMGLDTVAEGIETPEQARLVGESGWEHAQGRLFGHPMPSLAGNG